MYRIDDVVSAIKEIQRLLGISKTGVYDAHTRNAVYRIQDKRSLQKTGTVDYSTFKAIVANYRERMADTWESDLLFSASFPYLEGYIGENAGRINEALATVLADYSYEGVSPRGKYIGADTMLGVNYLREVFGMPTKDEIDARFMNRIIAELARIEIKGKSANK